MTEDKLKQIEAAPLKSLIVAGAVSELIAEVRRLRELPEVENLRECFDEIKHLRSENEKLRAENEELKDRNSRLETVVSSDSHLQGALITLLREARGFVTMEHYSKDDYAGACDVATRIDAALGEKKD